MRRLLILLLLGVLIGTAAPAAVRAGEVIDIHFTAPSLGRDWDYRIYLPSGYGRSARRYKVIYLLHGFADDPVGWVTKAGIDEIADELIDSGAIPPCLIVMPSAGRSWYVNGPEPMEAAFFADLVPEIDTRFQTIPTRDGRMIGGLSMGGFGAMRLALLHPDKFSAMALMSPAIYMPEPPARSAARSAPAFQTDGVFDPQKWQRMNYASLLDGFAASGRHLRVQLTAGEQDPLQTDLAAMRFTETWRARGWKAQLLLRPGRHDFVFWRTILPSVLTFLGKSVVVAAEAAPALK